MPLFHVWFGTKRRKWLLQGSIAEAAKELMWAVAKEKDIRLMECETMPEHVHLLVEAEGRTQLSRSINLLKGSSSRRLFQALPEQKLDAGINSLWQHRYASKVVPERAVTAGVNYIRPQWDGLENYER